MKNRLLLTVSAASLSSIIQLGTTSSSLAACSANPTTSSSVTCDSTAPATFVTATQISGNYWTAIGQRSTNNGTVNIFDGSTISPSNPTVNANAISLGNNATINIYGIVQNQPNSNTGGGWSTGNNTVETGYGANIFVGSNGKILSLGSATNDEAINIHPGGAPAGSSTTITNYGLIQATNNNAIFIEQSGDRVIVNNYGTIARGPIGNPTGGDVFGGSTSTGIDFTNFSSGKVYGNVNFGSGNDTLTLFTGSLITGSANGSGGTDTLYLKGDGSDTLGGNISGFENLYKSDPGSWTLGGTSSFTNTEVQGGNLVVTGSLTSPVSILGSGTLQGTGTVTGNVTNSGNLSPGLSNVGGSLSIVGNVVNNGNVNGYDATSNLNITGNYTQNASGNFVTHVNGLTTGSYSQITYTGQLNMASGTKITADLNPALKLNAGDVIPGVIQGNVTAPSQSGAITVDTISDRYKLLSRYSGSSGQNVDLYLPDSGILNAYDSPGTYYGALEKQTLESVSIIQVPQLGVLHQRYAVLNAVSEYDCNKFDKYNVCISFQVRATGFGTQATGAGVFNIAYRPTPQTHVGIFIDYQAAAGNPSAVNSSQIATMATGNVQYGYNNPTFGGYAGFSQSGYNGNLINNGVQVFVSGAYNPGKVAISRPLVMNPYLPFVDSQPGSGNASLNASVIRGLVGYGIPLTDMATLMPYGGMRFTDVTRGGYMEGFNSIVTQPLVYNSYYERLFTGFGGAMLNGRLTSQFGTLIGLGFESDFSRYANSMSGYSPNAIQNLTVFGFEHGGSWNGLRPTANAGTYYDITPTQRLSLNGFVGQQAFTTRTYATGLLGYQVAF